MTLYLDNMAPELDLPGCEPFAAYDDIDHEQWLELRTKGIGSSDAAATMGMSRYGSPLTIVMDKTGRMEAKDLSEVEVVQVGNLLEPLIRSTLVAPYIKKITDKKVEVFDPHFMYRSKEYPWMILNPDGFVLLDEKDLVGLEIKTGSSYKLKEWGGIDGTEVPDEYYVQCQHNNAVTGLAGIYLFGLIGNNRVVRYIPRNEEFITQLIERERVIWEMVKKNDPLNFPLPCGTDADMEALMILGNPQDGGMADVTGANADLDAYLDLGTRVKSLEAEREVAKQRILMKLGTHKFGSSDRFKVTNTMVTQQRIDADRLKAELPGTYTKYLKTSEYGRLTVKELKE
jgi:putative phage-type endonuclease